MSAARKPGRPRKSEASPSARQRILDAARDEFYARGIEATSIDLIAAKADVAKMTVYQHFPTKEALAVAYVRRFEEDWNAWLAEGPGARSTAPRAQLLRIFDRVGAFIAREGFCGCAFINAAVESRAGSAAVAEAALDQRKSAVRTLEALARDAGARAPKHLAEVLILLIDGALVGAAMRRPGDHAGEAKKAAAALIDAATPSATSPRTSSRRSPTRP
jgi:AcrR family transcriptional regulator